MELKTYMEMDITELEEIIEKEYGHSVELMADMELNNYTYFTIQEKKKEMHPEDQKELEEFKRTGNAQYKVNAIWQDLVNRDILSEELEYLIIVNY
jgi:hypothetical protein